MLVLSSTIITAHLPWNSPATVISNASFVFGDWLLIATSGTGLSPCSHACFLVESLIYHLVDAGLECCGMVSYLKDRLDAM